MRMATKKSTDVEKLILDIYAQASETQDRQLRVLMNDAARELIRWTKFSDDCVHFLSLTQDDNKVMEAERKRLLKFYWKFKKVDDDSAEA